MQFVGEQVRFSLLLYEIDGIVIGRGGPSWWKFERVYVRWKSADGRNGIFNLNSLEPGSVWQSRQRVRTLCQRLQAWHRLPGAYPEVRPELAGLGGLEVRQVTSISPRNIGKWSVNMTVFTYLLPLAIGVGILTRAGTGYLCASVFLLRMFQSVPYWRYRDEVPVFPKADISSKARGASA